MIFWYISKDKAEHANHLRIVLQILREHAITKEGIAINPNKVQAVIDWKAPKNVKKVHGFLGMVGYYQRFIEGFSKIARPMTKLLRKDVPFE
jgi:hypothetical protein